MTAAVAAVNLVLGVAYCGYGVMTMIDMRRDRGSFGFSHFGMAWICMAFTCGPHHLFHGIHVAFEGRAGGSVDLLSVVVGLPAGVLWLCLRVEAFAGGRGDRYVPGTPLWLRAVTPLSIAYAAMIGVAVYRITGGAFELDALVVTSALLVVIYLAIGWFIVRTQLANRPSMGGWSVSGLCLSAVFPTCALMHAVWGAYHVAGRYTADRHGLVINWLSVPAGLYFLWVVRGLYQDTFRDWNAGPGEVRADLSPLAQVR